MKVLIICFLIGYILAFTPKNSTSCALKYCDYKFHYTSDTLYQIGFIQMCMRDGGLNLDCLYTSSSFDDGTLESLQNCLVKKGWKVYKKRPTCFKAGYPIYIDNANDFTMSKLAIATYVDKKTIKYSMRHPNICNAGISKGDEVTYFCPA